MSVLGHLLLSGQDGYNISRSVRLRSSASAYFNRTPASAGNRQKFTVSVWYKAGGISSSPVNANILNAGGDGSSLLIAGTGAFGATYQDRLMFREAGTTLFYWPMVFRDPSAWYHIVFAMDTTQATAANRAKLYVNGVDQGAFSGTAITQNTNTSINNTSAHYINTFNGTNYPSDLYFTEYNFIDGQALTSSSFGENDTITGVWKPKKYAGTYGTNGFYLNFSDNSNNTATTIGKDYSGNGNNWTPNNISVTSGATYDSMLDVPTPYADGGNGRGNYAVLNPIGYDNATNTINDGNLKVAWTSGGNSYKASTIGMTSGKWYCEFYIDVVSTAAMPGLVNDLASMGYPGNNGTGNGYGYYYDGQKYTAGVGAAYGSSYTSGDVIGIAYDADSGKLWFSKNGTWQASGDPAAGTNAAFTGLSTSRTWFFVAGHSGSATMTANFGQRPFAYTPPSGFNALNTQNLPAPTISNGANYMTTLLWTSNASVKSVTGSAFQPDLVWVKDRQSASANEGYHHLVDSVRGAGKVLSSNATLAEYWSGTNQSVTAFNSNGFTTGIYDGLNGDSMVTWLWNAGSGSSSSNTSGSITSTVSVNATAGFSVVTYTGTGANATVGHGLGVAPSMIIIKCRGSATDPSWIVGHTGVVMGTGRLILNGTDANSNAGASVLWNSTAATSTVFSLGNYSSVNQSTLTYVAYCFSAVRGYSAFGSYTGNGSSDGPFVFLGFRPRWVMIKNTSAANQWNLWDTSRNTYNVMNDILVPSSSGAETNSYPIDILSNGFKIRGGAGLAMNDSSNVYIYAAFAENPFKLALAR